LEKARSLAASSLIERAKLSDPRRFFKIEALQPAMERAMIPATYLGDNRRPTFCWVIETSVGLRAQNSNRQDISYVQWYYSLVARNPIVDQGARDVYAQVRVTGFCDGTENDPLVSAIWFDQQRFGYGIDNIRDQKLDPPKTRSGHMRSSGAVWMILKLSARLCTMYPYAWPRLDQIPGCPDPVKEAVFDALIITSPDIF
jgi:hypothetical protein